MAWQTNWLVTSLNARVNNKTYIGWWRTIDWLIRRYSKHAPVSLSPKVIHYILDGKMRGEWITANHSMRDSANVFNVVIRKDRPSSDKVIFWRKKKQSSAIVEWLCLGFRSSFVVSSIGVPEIQKQWCSLLLLIWDLKTKLLVNSYIFLKVINNYVATSFPCDNKMEFVAQLFPISLIIDLLPSKSLPALFHFPSKNFLSDFHSFLAL
jgi:hypothetical protein